MIGVKTKGKLIRFMSSELFSFILTIKPMLMENMIMEKGTNTVIIMKYTVGCHKLSSAFMCRYWMRKKRDAKAKLHENKLKSNADNNFPKSISDSEKGDEKRISMVLFNFSLKKEDTIEL